MGDPNAYGCNALLDNGGGVIAYVDESQLNQYTDAELQESTIQVNAYPLVPGGFTQCTGFPLITNWYNIYKLQQNVLKVDVAGAFQTSRRSNLLTAASRFI